MYNAHRGIVGAAPSNRLNELMEQLRQEFDNQSRGSGELEHQSTSNARAQPKQTPPSRSHRNSSDAAIDAQVEEHARCDGRLGFFFWQLRAR